MRIYSLIIVMILALVPLQIHAAEALIAASVNDKAIAASEVKQRMRLIAVSSGLPNTPEVREKLQQQVMSALIDEQIKLQEADKLGVQVSPEDIESGMEQIAKQNNMNAAQFRNAITQSGIDVTTMEDQIRAEIAWTKIVQGKLRSDVVVSDADVENVMDRFARLNGTEEFLVAEIVIPVDDPNEKSEAQIKKLSQDLVTQMRAGKAPFVGVARQFSKAAGAQNGGNVGWIRPGQLPEELDKALQALQPSELSDPIRTPEGYHILLLREKRVISPETTPDDQTIRNEIGTERLNRLGQQYFLGLKSKAMIDKRM